VFPNPKSLSDSHLLSLLPSDPPTAELIVGVTSKVPPTSSSLEENHRFLDILHSVIGEHAHEDPDVISQASAMASSAGGHLGAIQAGNAAGGASDQGGAGGAGRGGWIHVSDQRNPPDYGRIAWPEDIFGSVEVDGKGRFVDGHGHYQPSGTYRIITREGILGLSPFLREKMVQRLRLEEAAIKN
jgi:hypothetical protein